MENGEVKFVKSPRGITDRATLLRPGSVRISVFEALRLFYSGGGWLVEPVQTR